MTQTAIDYARRGWAVFPCKPKAKEPATPHGFKDASKDPATIAEQFERMPSANIGIATGTASGVWVLDIDPRNGGDESIRKLAADGLDLGETLTAITGGGGLHYFYRVNGAPVRCRSNVWRGVDVKGDGGYIVAPGSIHPSGESYEWMNESPIIDAPDWLIQAVTAEPAKPEPIAKPSSGDTGKTLAAILEIKTTDNGDGSKRLYTAACRCVEHGLSDGDALAAIRAYAMVRPFPRDWTDTQIIQRIRDAEAKVTRGAVVSTANRAEPVCLRMDEVQAEPVSWLWPNRIAVGKLTLLAGDPSLGKSLLTLDLASRISRGTAWPDCQEIPNPPGAVVILSSEDDPADTIKPRLLAAGADCRRVVAFTGIRELDPETGEACLLAFTLVHDLALLERVIETTAECRAVVMDPITAYMGKTDSHKNADVRGLLSPLSELAARRRVAILGITHLNKSGAGAAMYRSMGSLAFVAAARAAWLVAKDQSDPARRLFLPIKNNLAPDGGGLAFRIIDEGNGPCLQWEADPVNVTADDSLAVDHAERPERAAAADWLREALSDGPMEAKRVIYEARENGIAEKTLRRAATELGIKPHRPSFQGGWIWGLPQDGQQKSVAILGNNGHLGDSGSKTGGIDGPDHAEDGQSAQDGQSLERGHLGQDGGDYRHEW